MPQRFPCTARSTFTKLSGAAPGAAISLTPEESVFLIAAKEAVAPTPLNNTVAPAVTGTASVGQTLTSTQGTWTGSNGVYTYIWQQSFDNGATWSPIPSGNGANTFVLTSQQLGAKIRCVVRGINGAGPRFGYSAAVGPVA
jgi:hypothetical protein